MSKDSVPQGVVSTPVGDGTETCIHQWSDEYNGTKCKLCQLFYPTGCAPWDQFDEDHGEYDEYEEDDPYENCSGWFEEGSGRFVCGAVGSEDCDCCPCYNWLGLTSDEVDELEDEP